MPSSNLRTKRKFLRILADFDANYCFLGTSLNESSDEFSDIDLAFNVSPAKLHNILKNFSPDVFLCLSFWEYDHGCFSSIWLDKQTFECAQVDFMTLHVKSNRYGFRPNGFVNDSYKKNGVRLANENDMRIYRIVKWWAKGKEYEHLIHKTDYSSDKKSVRSLILNKRGEIFFGRAINAKRRSFVFYQSFMIMEGLITGRLIKRLRNSCSLKLVVNPDFYRSNSKLFSSLEKGFLQSSLYKCSYHVHLLSKLKFNSYKATLSIILCNHNKHNPSRDLITFLENVEFNSRKGLGTYGGN